MSPPGLGGQRAAGVQPCPPPVSLLVGRARRQPLAELGVSPSVSAPAPQGPVQRGLELKHGGPFSRAQGPKPAGWPSVLTSFWVWLSPAPGVCQVPSEELRILANTPMSLVASEMEMATRGLALTVIAKQETVTSPLPAPRVGYPHPEALERGLLAGLAGLVSLSQTRFFRI